MVIQEDLLRDYYFNSLNNNHYVRDEISIDMAELIGCAEIEIGGVKKVKHNVKMTDARGKLLICRLVRVNRRGNFKRTMISFHSTTQALLVKRRQEE